MESYQKTEATADTYKEPLIRKQDENWARSEEEKKQKPSHLFKVFKLNPRNITQEKENRLLSDDSCHIGYSYKSLLSMK